MELFNCQTTGEYPSFEELMNSVLELEKEIHEIK